MATPCTRLEWIERPAGRIAVLVLDDPERSANILSAGVLDEIQTHLDTVDSEANVAGLVIISAKPGMFIAGADLKEFAASLDKSKEEIVAVSRRGQQLFGRLASGSYVTVAAIDGICVGGGAELAIWCDRRVLTDTPKTQFGFPEVKLGLFPGWGGTARTPRMIGLANAVELVTGGENVAAREARQLAIADDLVSGTAAPSGAADEPLSAAGLLEGFPLPDSALPLCAAAVRMIEADHASGDHLRNRECWSAPLAMSETELAFLGATASAVIQKKTKGHYPAPLAALEVMLEASQLDLEAACQREADGFAPLFGSPVNRSLLNVFFLNDAAKKNSAQAAPLQTASVIGAGVMGQGIAAANAKRGVAVTLSDSRPDALAAGLSGVVAEASYDKTVKGPSADKAIQVASLVAGTTEPEQIATADVVIEAIVENADVKRDLFRSLEPHLGQQTILCSNTSTIPITKLAGGLQHPERFCGLHFFNPVRKMPLVEVIRGEQTSDATIAAMTAYARQLGKTPVVVNDGPGFLVNRLLMPYMAEAALMASEGVPIAQIDKAAKRFGMPMGPLELHDVVGLDVCLHAGRVMQQAFPDRVADVPIIEQLVDVDRLGQKNGRGFFDYPPPKPGKPPKGAPSDEVASLLAGQAATSKPELEYDVTERLILPMFVEATRAIEDGIVGSVADVDLALILGIGFPPFQGGLFHWADSVGAAVLNDKLDALAPLGRRFEPTAYITAAGKSGKTFY